MSNTHLDVAAWLEPVQLIDELKHGSLHLVFSRSVHVFESRPTDSVYLVEEDDASLFRS